MALVSSSYDVDYILLQNCHPKQCMRNLWTRKPLACQKSYNLILSMLLVNNGVTRIKRMYKNKKYKQIRGVDFNPLPEEQYTNLFCEQRAVLGSVSWYIQHTCRSHLHLYFTYVASDMFALFLCCQ